MPKKEDTRLPHQVVKDMCPLFEAWGVTQLVCRYNHDGSNGWAGFSELACEFGTRDEHQAPFIDGRRYGQIYADERIVEPSAMRSASGIENLLGRFIDLKLIDRAAAEKFRQALRQLLPVGWCAHPGSFGTLLVNTLSGVITLDHTARVIREEHQDRVTFNAPAGA